MLPWKVASRHQGADSLRKCPQPWRSLKREEIAPFVVAAVLFSLAALRTRVDGRAVHKTTNRIEAIKVVDVESNDKGCLGLGRRD